MVMNENKVIVFAIVDAGRMVTAYVPTVGEGPAPEGSDDLTLVDWVERKRATYPSLLEDLTD